MSPPHETLQKLFEEHRRFLWGLCYRMTGSAADADDLVQETFVRAMERPPARQDDPWRPWLVTVALNLSRDALRQRKRRGYVGPWLPSPIETGDEHATPSFEIATPELTTESRYDLLESVSFAFLLALEALTPRQRAVLLLRDVFDYSVRETADALHLSESNVKTTHHRARRAMEDYHQRRQVPTAAHQEHTRHALQRFMAGLAAHDVTSIERMLAEDVRVVSDGGGEFIAALNPIVGRRNAIPFLLKISERRDDVRVATRLINGAPALVLEWPRVTGRFAPRAVFRFDLNERGEISAVHTVLATRKLSAIGPIEAP